LLDTFRTRHADLMGTIRDTGAMPDESAMRQAVDDFKAAFLAKQIDVATAAAAADVTDTDADALGDAASAKTLDTE
jgi:hypothetical protein